MRCNRGQGKYDEQLKISTEFDQLLNVQSIWSMKLNVF